MLRPVDHEGTQFCMYDMNKFVFREIPLTMSYAFIYAHYAHHYEFASRRH